MTNTRQSGIELLRIAAMFLVMILHINGLAVGLPSSSECASIPGISFLRFLIQSISVICVDVFILISGWFGINFRIERLTGFIFQCLFFSTIVTLLAWLLSGRPEIDLKSVAGMVFLGKSYWFVKSYLLLYVLSPVLNRFIDNSTAKEMGLITLLFLGIMLVYGWSDSMTEFNFGYSTLSFVGLYMLARYLRKYGQCLTERSPWFFIIIFLSCSVCLAYASLLLYGKEAPFELTRCLFSYDNPFVIASALSCLLLFSGFKFYSPIVNRVAKSAFAVYLFHVGTFRWGLFMTLGSKIYRCFDGVTVILVMLLFLVGVFALACLIDQVRLALWNFIKSKFVRL